VLLAAAVVSTILRSFDLAKLAVRALRSFRFRKAEGGVGIIGSSLPESLFFALGAAEMDASAQPARSRPVWRAGVALVGGAVRD